MPGTGDVVKVPLAAAVAAPAEDRELFVRIKALELESLRDDAAVPLAVAALSRYLKRTYRIPPSLGGPAAARLVKAALDAPKSDATELLRIVAIAFDVSSAIALEVAQGNVADWERAGHAVEAEGSDRLLQELSTRGVVRGERSRLIAALSERDAKDIGPDRVDNAERRAKRRLALFALRKMDRRMMPLMVDPFAAPKGLQSKSEAGRLVVYSVGSDLKDNGGDKEHDLVLTFVVD